MGDEHSLALPLLLELTARTSLTEYFNRPFHTLSENVFILADIASCTLETFCLMGYISLFYLLTYLLTPPHEDYKDAADHGCLYLLISSIHTVHLSVHLMLMTIAHDAVFGLYHTLLQYPVWPSA